MNKKNYPAVDWLLDNNLVDKFDSDEWFAIGINFNDRKLLDWLLSRDYRPGPAAWEIFTEEPEEYDYNGGITYIRQKGFAPPP